MIDAHFHFSVGSDDFTEFQWNNNKILSKYDSLIPLLKDKNVSEIYGIFAHFNKGLKELVKKREIIVRSGLYLMLYMEPEKVLKDTGYDYDFIKFHHHICDPLTLLDMFKEKVEKCIELGFRRFQLHTSMLTSEGLSLLSEYSKSGVKFYLAHGASALKYAVLYNNLNTDIITKIIDNNILLGTSEPTFVIPSPLDSVTYALRQGLEDNLCFETDYSFNFETEWYNVYHKVMGETIPYNKKIYEDNAKKFMK